VKFANVIVTNFRQYIKNERPSLCVVIRDRTGKCTGTISGTIPAQNNVGSVQLQNIFLFRSRDMLSIFSILSETVATVSPSVPLHPLLSRTYDAEQTSVTKHHRRCCADSVLMLAISCWLRV